VTARRQAWVARLGAAALAVLALIGGGATPARARYMTGAALLDWCRDDASTFCPGYLAALADYQSALQAIDARAPRFCLPSNVKLAALREVATGPLAALPPDRLRAAAADVMIEALVQRFPPTRAREGCTERAAAYVTGYELIDWCADETSRLCAGYVAALVDYQDLLQRDDSETPRFCLPADQRLSDLTDLALRRLRANPPGELRKLAASLVVPAFARTYPCR